MIDKLKAKLSKEGRSFKWFISTYLDGKSYSTIMQQINGFYEIQNETKEAIESYLGE